MVFYFDPATKSPVSMLELGYMLAADSNRLHVCCPQGFWRKGNIDIICSMKGVPALKSLDELIEAVKEQLK